LPRFNAAIYALDLLLPLVDLSRQSAFNLEAVAQWLSCGLIAASWVSASTAVAGVPSVLGN
jgi:hypothetical protein